MVPHAEAVAVGERVPLLLAVMVALCEGEPEPEPELLSELVLVCEVPGVKLASEGVEEAVRLPLALRLLLRLPVEDLLGDGVPEALRAVLALGQAEVVF